MSTSPSPKTGILVLPSLLGMLSIALQGLLFREHAQAYGGNDVGTAVFLAGWVGWAGVGALVSRPFFRTSAPRKLTLLLALYIPFAMAELFCIWSLRAWAGLGPLDLYPMDLLAFWTLVATAPFSLLTGALFVGLAESRRSVNPLTSWNVGTLFALEALGAVVGGVAVSLCFAFGVPSMWVYLVALLVWAAGIGWPLWRLGPLRNGVLHVAIGLALLVWTLLGAPGQLSSIRLHQGPLPDTFQVQEDFDTPASHVTIGTIQGQTAVFEDGHLSATYPDSGRSRTLAATFATMAQGAPQSVLVLGQGQEELVCELSALEGWTVVWGHPHAALQERLNHHLPARLHACLTASNVVTHFADPLSFLAQMPDRFDLIALEFPDPTGTASSRFLTHGFLLVLAKHLAPAGRLTLELALPPADAGPAVAAYAQSVSTTLSSVFPRTALTSGRALRFWATDTGTLPTHPEEWVRSFQAIESQFPELAAEHLLEEFESYRTLEWRERLALMGAGPIIDDSRPAAYAHHLRIQQRESRLLVLLGLDADTQIRLVLWSVAAFLVAWLAWGLGKGPGANSLAPLVALAAGHIGMVAHLLLLLLFQLRFGSLQLHFALLNAAYMVGLAASGMTPLLWKRATGNLAAWALPLCAAAALLLPLGALYWVLFGASELPVAGYAVAAAVAGLGSGVSLVLTSQQLTQQSSPGPDAAAWFQSLDSLGAVSGALLAGWVWIPSMGPARTLGTMAVLVVALLALQALWCAGLLGRPAESPACRGAPTAVASPLVRRVLLWALLTVAGASALGLLDFQQAPQAERLDPRLRVTAPAVPGARVVATGPYAQQVSGYGGPMNLQLTLDSQERVLALEFLNHNETPEYVAGIAPFFASFVGREAPTVQYGKPDDPNGVQAFTGATFTGKAVTENVRLAGAAMRQQRLDTERRAITNAVRLSLQPSSLPAMPVAEVSPDGPNTPFPWSAALLALVALLAIGAYFTGRQWIRMIVLVLALVVSGVWLNSQLTLSEFVRWLEAALPLGNLNWLVALGALLLGLLLAGPLFCGYMCPFGALQDLLAHFGLQWRAPVTTERALRKVKYGIAIVSLLAGAVIGIDAVFRFDPLSFAFSFRWDDLAVAILLVILAGSLVWHRPWCRFLCPLGAVCSLGQNLGLAQPLSPKRNFARCHLGVTPNDLDCIRCNRCVALCQPKARWFHRKASQILLWAFVVALVGLGLARILSSGSSKAVANAPSSHESPAEYQTSSDPAASSPTHDRAPNSIAPGGDAGASSGLIRSDSAQYSVQRDVDILRLQQRIQQGEASSHEALFWVTVPQAP